MGIFYKISRDHELKMATELKELLDEDANFVRPLSDFWNGCTKEQLPGVYGRFGLWLSGEGGSMIDGEYAADYYSKNNTNVHEKLQDFVIANNLELVWFDCGTPLLFKKLPTSKF